MKHVGIDEKAKLSIFRILSGILSLGNVEFISEKGEDGEAAQIKTMQPLEDAAFLWEVPVDQLRQALLIRTNMIRGELFKTPLPVSTSVCHIYPPPHPRSTKQQTREMLCQREFMDVFLIGWSRNTQSTHSDRRHRNNNVAEHMDQTHIGRTNQHDDDVIRGRQCCFFHWNS
eukprot:TRINITY_DN190_c0_g1_i5.p1 TRINITY_DN190_c0_g1~~TRINITY_DN190_c0_g1_i5.p1  ORF type:complete len:172 (+),score=35.57 TRINITY_DN190_c0_g1_i5:930-1445(+)